MRQLVRSMYCFCASGDASSQHLSMQAWSLATQADQHWYMSAHDRKTLQVVPVQYSADEHEPHEPPQPSSPHCRPTHEGTHPPWHRPFRQVAPFAHEPHEPPQPSSPHSRIVPSAW